MRPTSAFAASVLLTSVASASAIPDVSSTLQNILQNTHGSDLYTYPTDLTRGIIPKPFHSHNDYWRDIPFYSALSYGAISVESDVWLINGTLYVGHEMSALTTSRTFSSLYVQPILDVLKRQNPTTPFISGTSTKNGVFDTSSGQTLYLFVDVKTDGNETWPVVLRELEPLQQAGYLSSTDGKTFSSGPVTVVGTGNTPLSYFLPTDPASSFSPRYAFYDAPLATLNSSSASGITSLISPIASTDFAAVVGNVVAENLTDSQRASLRTQIGYAKSKGIGARYWDQPGWPIGTRNAIWRILLDEGVGLLNVDNLAGAAAFWENMG